MAMGMILVAGVVRDAWDTWEAGGAGVAGVAEEDATGARSTGMTRRGRYEDTVYFNRHTIYEPNNSKNSRFGNRFPNRDGYCALLADECGPRWTKVSLMGD
jgi:hypothetical protein